ncbi:biopolymer transporter ExbD [Diaphorobacter sp.]|uniref:ExbD/TolR family protein n=1 Tax=Diaphorobacter sp. TaxID=1934310 RepID=UPI0028B15D11|nr:biopolymer transporter ExbD [Diaphorobacter sp.]
MAFGRLQSASQPKPMSDINVTPLVDVMLVLVVIFILTAPLLASAIRVDLPKTDGAAPGAAAQRPLSVALDAAGQAFVNDEPVAQDDLPQLFRQSASQGRDTEVQLRADSSVPYGRVVELMGELHKAGLTRIAFVTQSPAATSASATASSGS